MDPSLTNVNSRSYASPPQEQIVGDVESALSFDLPDKELISLINKKVSEGDVLRQEKVIKMGQINSEYWSGKQQTKTLKDQKTKVVENVIFRNIETIIPILTSNTPEEKIYHPNKEFTETLRKVLELRWEVTDKMLDKSRIIIRDNFKQYIGFLKFRYDEEYDDICVEEVAPEFMIIDNHCTCYYDCEYAAQIMKPMTVEELTELYPYGGNVLLKKLGYRAGDTKVMGTKVSILEFHTPEFSVWKYEDVILDKQKNPNWDWAEATSTDDYGKTSSKAYNILKKPTVPYIFFQTFNGRTAYSDTSLIEQAIPGQDVINKLIRLIVNNADDAGGILTTSGDFMTKDEFQKVINGAVQGVWFEKGNPQQGLNRVGGQQLEQYVFQLLAETKQEVDNLMGAHSTTRGQTDSKTATQSVMDKQQDYGRIDDIVKHFESFSEDYYNMMLQMMIVHYNESHFYPIENEQSVEVSRDILIKEFSKIPKLVTSELGEKYTYQTRFVAPIVMVKRGSTLPIDDVSKMNAALQLWSQQGIDPLSLFEDLNDPNPERKAIRLFLWSDPSTRQMLFPEMAQYLNPQQGQDKYSQGMKDDTNAIKNGETPPVNQEVQSPDTAQAHIEAHSAYMDSPEFKKLSPIAKKRYIAHVTAEVQQLREEQAAQQAAQAQQAQAPQPMMAQPMAQPPQPPPMQQPLPVQQLMQ